MTATARTVTLNAAQVRAVLVGLGATDDVRRTHAVGVMADVLTAAPVEPTITVTDPHLDRERAIAAFIEAERSLARTEAAPAVDDECGRAPVDAERERRRVVVEEAARWVATYDRTAILPAAWRTLCDAVEALREYTPAEVAAPADDEPAPAAGPSVRDELHDLAPLPWRHDDGGQVEDRSGRRVLDVDGFPTVAEDERVAALLVALVNGPEWRNVDAATDARHRAERAVLDAGRLWAGAMRGGCVRAMDDEALLRAVGDLDKVTDKGGTAT